MYRRLSLLSGVAILAIILNHAGGWGMTAMFWWADRYRHVSVPNYDAIGSITYYIVDTIHLMTVFAVPAFLFISGFFIAYAARGAQAGLGWKPVRARLITLLVPYLIWSVVAVGKDAALGELKPANKMLLNFVLLGSDGGLFYVIVLVTFYLLSPWIVGQARQHWRRLLTGAAVIQVIPILFRYLRLVIGSPSWLSALINWTPDQLFFRWAIFFPLGVVAGIHNEAFKAWLACHKRLVLVTLVSSYLLFFTETQLIYQATYRATGDPWRPGPSSIFFHLYGLAFILAFLAFEQVSVPFSRWITQFGMKSYGIYLTHFLFMIVVAKSIYHVLPWLLSQQFLFQPVMLAVGITGPLAFFWVVTHSPLRRFYPYLFG